MTEIIRILLDPFYNFLSTEYLLLKQIYQEKKNETLTIYNKIIYYMTIFIFIYFLKIILF